MSNNEVMSMNDSCDTDCPACQLINQRRQNESDRETLYRRIHIQSLDEMPLRNQLLREIPPRRTGWVKFRLYLLALFRIARKVPGISLSGILCNSD